MGLWRTKSTIISWHGSNESGKPSFPCISESTTYKFGLDRGLITFEHFEDDRKDTTSDTLAFGFKTIQDFAVLARIDSADTNDFIEMELVSLLA